MKKLCFLLMMELLSLIAFAQADTLAKARFVIGISAPELLHIGINTDIGQSNQLGFSAGIGPTMDGVWPTLTIEHRFYFGPVSAHTDRRQWFCKQGATYFTAGDQQTALTLTIGADLRSKASSRGWTIDAGAFLLIQNAMDRTNHIYPALRFQHYNYFKKTKS